jgi:hypothetical protein
MLIIITSAMKAANSSSAIQVNPYSNATQKDTTAKTEA